MKNYFQWAERWPRKEQMEKCQGLDPGGGTSAKPGVPCYNLARHILTTAGLPGGEYQHFHFPGGRAEGTRRLNSLPKTPLHLRDNSSWVSSPEEACSHPKLRAVVFPHRDHAVLQKHCISSCKAKKTLPLSHEVFPLPSCHRPCWDVLACFSGRK